MPDLISHLLCGEKVLDELEDSIRNNIVCYRKIFNLGTQGPDIFYYSRVWPWMKNNGSCKIANTMHSKNTGGFFIESFKYLKSMDKTSKEYKQLFSYLCGFICHYILDSTTHPYIFYFSTSKSGRKRFSNYHKKMEVIIDVLLLDMLKKENAYLIKISDMIEISEDSINSLTSFYKSVLKSVYAIDVSEEAVQYAFKDITRVMRFMYDTKGIKRGFVKSVETLLGKKGMYSSAIYPKKVGDNKDYLNLNHIEWVHPCNSTKVYTDSFVDLFNRAISKSSNLISKAVSYLNDNDDENYIKEAFKNVSYNTNLPCEREIKMKFFKCIFD